MLFLNPSIGGKQSRAQEVAEKSAAEKAARRRIDGAASDGSGMYGNTSSSSQEPLEPPVPQQSTLDSKLAALQEREDEQEANLAAQLVEQDGQAAHVVEDEGAVAAVAEREGESLDDVSETTGPAPLTIGFGRGRPAARGRGKAKGRGRSRGWPKGKPRGKSGPKAKAKPRVRPKKTAAQIKEATKARSKKREAFRRQGRADRGEGDFPSPERGPLDKRPRAKYRYLAADEEWVPDLVGPKHPRLSRKFLM